MTYILLLVGFILLLKGADVFINGSSSIAKKLKIPSIIVGLTIVAFGTSAPEAAVSITASINGSNEMATANVVGSCIFNLLVVIGACAAIKPMNVDKSILKRDFPFDLIAPILLAILLINKSISRLDGVILLLFFAIFMVLTIKRALKSKTTENDENNAKIYSVPVSIILSVVGLVGIVFGGDLVVDCASKIARTFGASENLIGLTIVAMGTSLPELVTSIVAAKKGESDMALGNVIGSNIFNIFMVLGAAAAISPISVGMESIIDNLILCGISVLAFIFAYTKKTISRIEGIAFLAIYAGYMAYILIR